MTEDFAVQDRHGKHRLVPQKRTFPTLISPEHAESLVAWFNLYMQFEAAAGAENTAQAKRRDINAFLDFFTQAVGPDHADYWTRSMTAGFLRYLEKQEQKSPTTINRMLATLRHCANWIHRHRPFLAGKPRQRNAWRSRYCIPSTTPPIYSCSASAKPSEEQ